MIWTGVSDAYGVVRVEVKRARKRFHQLLTASIVGNLAISVSKR